MYRLGDATAPLLCLAGLLLLLSPCKSDYLPHSHAHIEANVPPPSMKEVSGTKVNFLEVNNPGTQPHVAVLLLHGARFSIQTWLDLGTVEILQRHGIHAVAVDLPGFGKSRTPTKAKNALGYAPDRATWLNNLIKEAMPGAHVVIISPSMSGSYAVPYIEKFGGQGDMVGWMPVAPVQIPSSWQLPQDITSKVKVVAFYGANDPKLPQADTIVAAFPGSKKVVVPNGSHPAYLDDPVLFHHELLELVHGATPLAALPSIHTVSQNPLA